MTNCFVSYDLNGTNPTHAEMDAHLKKISGHVRRVLETVWYVHSTFTMNQVFDYADQILSTNDRLIVINASDAAMRNLLVSNQTLQSDWQS